MNAGQRDGQRRLAIGLYLLACFLAQVWPIATWANRIEPRVLGLPFFFAWYVGGVFAVFAGLLALYASERSGSGE